MKVVDRVKNVDQRFKIGLTLLLVLTVGLIASTLQAGTHMPTDSTDVVYHTREADMEASAGFAGSSGSLTHDKVTTQDESSTRKIVTTVRTTLRVEDVSTAQEAVRRQVEEYNGFIKSTSIDQRNEVSGRMTVAVPDENLSEFTSGLESSYRVESQSSDRTDVTDRYNELEAELESKKKEMRQLEELMNRSESVSELVKIQDRMSELRSRINFLQKQLEDLDERVTYSKVYITFEGPELLKAEFDLRKTLFDAYRGVFQSIRLMILGAAYLLPFAVLVGLYKLVKAKARP